MDITRTAVKPTNAKTKATYRVSDVVRVHIPSEQIFHHRNKNEKSKTYSTSAVLPSYPFNPNALFRMVSDTKLADRPLILFPKIKKPESKPVKNQIQSVGPSENLIPQADKDRFTYESEPNDNFYSKLDTSWNQVIVWFYEESDKNAHVLLNSYRDYIVRKKLEVFRDSKLFKKAGSQQQLKILEILNRELESAQVQTRHKYILAAELNKLYHDETLSVIHKLALVNVVKTFGRYYVLQRYKLTSFYNQEANRLKRAQDLPSFSASQTNQYSQGVVQNQTENTGQTMHGEGRTSQIDFDKLEIKLDKVWDKIYFWLRENPINTMAGFEDKLTWFLTKTSESLTSVYTNNPRPQILEQLQLIKQIRHQLENEVEYITSPNFGFWLNAIYHSSSLSIFQRLIFVDIWRNFFQQLSAK